MNFFGNLGFFGFAWVNFLGNFANFLGWGVNFFRKLALGVNFCDFFAKCVNFWATGIFLDFLCRGREFFAKIQ